MSVILFTGGVSASVHAGIHPQGSRPPPQEQCKLGDTGNKQAVRILLECILVKKSKQLNQRDIARDTTALVLTLSVNKHSLNMALNQNSLCGYSFERHLSSMAKRFDSFPLMPITYTSILGSKLSLVVMKIGGPTKEVLLSMFNVFNPVAVSFSVRLDTLSECLVFSTSPIHCLKGNYTFKVCLHVTSPSLSPSKFNIVSMVMDICWEKWVAHLF